jgi:UV DNA damage endonuclease
MIPVVASSGLLYNNSMKIGYPCINRSLDCTSGGTFRLASYSRERLRKKIESNLDCLRKILEYNLSRELLFFRISSDIVPFASHPVCDLDWEQVFSDRLKDLGRFIMDSGMRISMHPDQFIVLNSPRKDVVERSVAELIYHADVLDGLGLGPNARIQLHVGGVYGNREKAIQRFIREFKDLPPRVRERLVLENDDRLYSLKDCMEINSSIPVPVLFDVFHHQCLNNGETIREALVAASGTWRKKDGIPMVDFSSQQKDRPKGTHASTIDISAFRGFLKKTRGIDVDIMLEIKDKEKSALKAAEEIKKERT